MARKLPKPINKEDFEKILEKAKKDLEVEWRPRKEEYTPTGNKIRDFIIAICLGYGAGMRISEVCGLIKKQRYIKNKGKADQVEITISTHIDPISKENIENNFIRIIEGKGKKDRVVPLPIKLFRRAGLTRSDIEKALPLKTKYRRMETMITRYGKQVLDKHITFHMLRHGFVTFLLSSGMPIHQVQALAGHARMDTTGLYAHANPKETIDQYQELDF